MRNICHLLAATSLVMGCSSQAYPSLGIPENESSDTGPVGLINGKPYLVKNVAVVLEAGYTQYLSAKREGRIRTL